MTSDALASEKAAIAELIARYNFAIDHNDFQGWADCFTPDGVFDGMIGRFAAHSELDRFTAEVKRLTADTPNLRHYVTNIMTEVDGDSASSTELYALLSELSGLPIQQGIAVTGSVNQKGHEKFF